MLKERELVGFVDVCFFCAEQRKAEDIYCGTCGNQLFCSLEKDVRVCVDQHDRSSRRGIFCVEGGFKDETDSSSCPDPDELVVYSDIVHDLSLILSEERENEITEHVLGCETCLAFLRELENSESNDSTFH